MQCQIVVAGHVCLARFRQDAMSDSGRWSCLSRSLAVVKMQCQTVVAGHVCLARCRQDACQTVVAGHVSLAGDNVNNDN